MGFQDVGKDAEPDVLLLESPGRGDLVVDARRLRLRVPHHLGRGTILTPRVDPACLMPLHPRRGRGRGRALGSLRSSAPQRLHPRKRVLVHPRLSHATRLRSQP